MASKTLHAEGVIEAVSRNGKAFKIGEDWFSVYKAGQMNDAKSGDEVEFDYVEKKVGGTVFLNVEGDVSVLNEGAQEEKPAPKRTGSARTTAKSAPARSASTSESPDQRQRSIVRQNSLTQANSLLETMARAGTLGDGSPEELAELAIELARVFEKYSMVGE